ncbi:hypothetical protein JXB31_01710 [Candidatus Woesearchaeota archaeon]|nr:hypothetical protein [Candidatus Woesearchaeota archaeon]
MKKKTADKRSYDGINNKTSSYSKTSSYKMAGVDVDIESMGAKILYNAAKETWKNRSGMIGSIISPFDDFSGIRAIDISMLPKGSMLCMGFDGVGTKAEIAQRMDRHDTIAFDLLAMVCDDAVLRGGEPVLAGSILDVNTLGTDESRLSAIKQLAEGYVKAAKEAGVAIINGELAQLGDAVGGHGKGLAYNWGAGLIWLARKDRLFTGKEIKKGDSIVMLKEEGFRSNGLSLVRRVFEENLGPEWHIHEFNGKLLGELVLTPSRIYSRAVVSMHGGFETEGSCILHGVAHITGGGIAEKLGRVLKPCRLGAELTDLFPPCDAMRYCQELRGIADKEAYRTWNMGQGMALITPEPEKVIAEAKKHGIEAKAVGRIVKGKRLTLVSQGAFSKGEEIGFDI